MKIYVLKNKQFLGTLVSREDKIVFTYDDKITKNKYIRDLGEKENISKDLFPIFQNLLPENEQLNFLKVKYNIKEEVRLLLYLENIQGSYEFYTQEDFKRLDLTPQHVFYYEPKICNRKRKLALIFVFIGLLKKISPTNEVS